MNPSQNSSYFSCNPLFLAFFLYISIFPLKRNTKGTEYTIDQDPDSLIISFSYLNINSSWKLVVCLQDCVKIYSENGQSLLGHIALNVSLVKRKEAEKRGIIHYFASSTKVLSNLKEFITVCSTLAEITFIEENKGSFNSSTVSLGNFMGLPTNLAFSSADNYVIIGNHEGKAFVFLIKDIKKLEFVKEIDINTKKTPITALEVLQRRKTESSDNENLLITGDFLGKVKIFGLKNFEIMMEINSHARLITSLDVKIGPFMEILTGSEDSFLNYWKIEEEDKGLKASLKVSFRIADQLIVGAKYMKNSMESVVSIYDSNEITVLKYEKS